MRWNKQLLSLMGLLAIATLSALRMEVTATATASEKAKSDEPLACHSNTDAVLAAPDDDNIKKINEELQDLYKQLNKTGDFEEPCNHSIVSKGGKSIEIIYVLEKFEMRRNNYRWGLWGYCANEGATALIASIKLFKEQLMGQDITICDQSKLLRCSERYGRCMCTVDNRNFRNIASDYYNASERNVGLNNTLNTSQCALVAGSDCPIILKDGEGEESSRFKCVPGTSCKLKHKPSDSCHLSKLRKPDNDSEKNTNRMFQSRYRREVNEEVNSSSSKPAEEAPNAVGRTEDGTLSADNGNYSILRDDYPSIYCQCVGYLKTLPIEGDSDVTMTAGVDWLLLVTLAWTVLAF